MAELSPTQVKCSRETCAKPIPEWYRASFLKPGARQPVFVSVIGDPGHGKTVFLSMLVSLLRSDMPTVWPTFACRQLQVSRDFEENVRLIDENRLPNSTRASFPEPVVYELQGMPYYGRRIVLFYDPPGEALRNPERFGRYAAFVRNSDCILLLVSLTQLRGRGTLADLGESMSKLVERCIEGLEGLDVQPQQQHCIIVFTKADQLDEIDLPAPALEYVSGVESYGVDMRSYVPKLKEQSRRLEEFTRGTLKANNFLKLASQYFRSVQFAAVSSLGGEPEQGRLITREPHRVLDPLIWTLDLTGRAEAGRQRVRRGAALRGWLLPAIVFAAITLTLVVFTRPNAARSLVGLAPLPTATAVPPTATAPPTASPAPSATPVPTATPPPVLGAGLQLTVMRESLDAPGSAELCPVSFRGASLTDAVIVDCELTLPAGVEAAVWSNDGQYLAISGDQRAPMQVIQQDGTSLALPVAPDEQVRRPVWRPDEAALTFEVLVVGQGYQIHMLVINPQTKAVERKILVAAPGDSIWPTWSSDGSRLAFANSAGADYQIYEINSAAIPVDGLRDLRLATPSTIAPGLTTCRSAATDAQGRVATFCQQQAQSQLLIDQQPVALPEGVSPTGYLLALPNAQGFFFECLYASGSASTPSLCLYDSTTGLVQLLFGPDGRYAYRSASLRRENP